MAKKIKHRTLAQSVWKRFRKNKLAMLGLVVLSFMVLLAVGVSVFGDYSTATKVAPLNGLQSPSSEHWFGTDHLGRDVFMRVLFGARVSLLWGLLSVLVALVFGTVIGATCGYFGGRVDTIIMRIVDIFMAIPAIILAIAVVAALGDVLPSLVNLLIAISVANIPRFARIVRSAVMSVKGQDYIEAATSFGSSNIRIIARHVIPNCLAPLIVSTTLSVGGSILTIAAMSFMGLGVQPPTPEWGYMMSEAQVQMRYHPNLILYPGLAIALTVMSFNLLGDGLRDALDPKLKN